MYIHGRDLDHTDISEPAVYNISTAILVWIHLRQYSGDDKGFEQLFAFWLERHFMDTKGEQITLFFDMTECKPRNMV